MTAQETLAEPTSIDAECLVAGGWEGSSDRDIVVNPGDLSDIVGSAPRLDAGAVDRTVRYAAKVQADWARLPAVERAAMVVKAAAAAAEVPGLAEMLTREQGKTIAEAREEVAGMALFAGFYAAKAEQLDAGELRTNEPGLTARIYSEPVGVVAIITPFNWPLGLSTSKAFPALIAGNAIVVKPAPTTPLAVIAAFRAMAEVLPKGLVSVVTGGVEVPEALCTHPLVRMVSFTGSTRTGGIVASTATRTLKNVHLELGGNDPALFLEDMVLTPELFRSLVGVAFVTTGQVCFALKRLYVPHAMVDDVVEGLGEVMSQFRVGPGMNPETTLGPLHNRAQRDIVSGMLAEAAQRGTVRRYGTMTVDPDSGWYLRPSLVTGLDESSALVAEEQFGPALPVIAYDDVDDAVARANSTEYGLTASVWSPDVERAVGVARRLQAGQKTVNYHGFNGSLEAPFGGVKQSGVGRELGMEGLLAYTDSQVVAVSG
jgi:acyl-CoA reductase-like NAD-dependent aldehyde dehydrogenase